MNYQITPSRLSATEQVWLQALFDQYGSEAAFWSVADIQQALLVPSTTLLLAVNDEPSAPQRLMGFLIARQMDHCAEIFYIWVVHDVRKRGIAQALCGKLEELLKVDGAYEVFLEVRISNQAARQLYEKIGYSSIGQRRKYYADGENALVLMKRLGD